MNYTFLITALSAILIAAMVRLQKIEGGLFRIRSAACGHFMPTCEVRITNLNDEFLRLDICESKSQEFSYSSDSEDYTEINATGPPFKLRAVNQTSVVEYFQISTDAFCPLRLEMEEMVDDDTEDGEAQIGPDDENSAAVTSKTAIGSMTGTLVLTLLLTEIIFQ
jgi:hypothetical protein